jgi:hypothetical protein
VITLTYQPALRPALPCVYGPLDYREQRVLFERIDSILTFSGLEGQSIALAATSRKFDIENATVKSQQSFAKISILALRSNIDRSLTGLYH